VRLWLEAGADTIDLVLPFAVPEQQLREMLEAAAPAATPSAGERTMASLPPAPAPRLNPRGQSEPEATRP
jgi:hypothetical protein